MKKVRWQERRHTLTKIFNYRNQGMNSTEIADALNAENHLTKKGLQWRNDNVDNFVYTCRKSGMREQTIKKEKQQILSVQPTQITIPTIPAASTTTIDLIKLIVESRLPVKNKTNAITALLNE